MNYIKRLQSKGFKDLFLASTASTVALLTLFFTTTTIAFFVFFMCLFVSGIIYKYYGSLIDSFFIEQRLTNKFAQGLVVGTIFGWTFGRTYFG